MFLGSKSFCLLVIIFIAVILFNPGCKSHNKKYSDNFYDTISEDWDFICIPVIKPYRVGSTDNGRSWLLELNFGNSVMVSKFAVSKNFIYGYGSEVIISGQPKKGWFAFDINSKLLAVYPSRQELTSLLNDFNIPVNSITDCNKYSDSLGGGYRLSWYPKNGRNYPSYPEIHSKDIIEIKVTENAKEKPDFYFDPIVPLHKNRVYFFKITYNKKQNNLYYLSFPFRDAVLVKDNLLVPVFIDSNKLDITLFTPFPIGEEKKIPESERFLKTKTMSVQ